jgi:glycosyltransferase involved in cell wall biosynthesis
MEISVVIPTLNRAGDIRACIAAMEKQDLPKKKYEIIVVDNGSTDGTQEFLGQKADEGVLRFLIQEKRGAGAARNLGVGNSAAKFIAFTDDDCIPEPGWLSALLAGFPDDEKCAGIGGPILSTDEKNVVSRYWKYCRVWDRMGSGGRTVHIPTMNVLYRRSALLDVGIFDEDVVGIEDIHLSQKITRKGYYLKYIDGGRVCHKEPTDIGTIYRKCHLNGRGTAIVARKMGARLKTGRLRLIKSLFFRNNAVDILSRGEELSLYERLAFGFLHKVSIIGMHNGYSHEMKNMKRTG